MNRHRNAVSAKDILISCADKLPANLMIDAVNAHGKFSIEFILRLTEDQLACLNAETKKKGNENVFLDFSTIQQGSTCCPTELKNFSDFDWYKVSQIKISGDPCPYLHSIHSASHYYISIVFVLKE